MADDFRKMQKTTCKDGRPNGGKFPYGCSCCRMISNLSKFKKKSRKLARAKLKHKDQSNLACSNASL